MARPSRRKKGLFVRQPRKLAAVAPADSVSEETYRRWIQETIDWYTIPEPNSGCVLWVGSVDKDGYGRLSLNMIRPKKRILAHRAMYAMHVGPIPNGLDVLHSCDVPCCVNQMHLRVGTKADNADDCKRRGRTLVGEKCSRHKLTTDEVKQILADPRRHSYIAKDYGVVHSTISTIKYNKTWRFVPRNGV